ncbi:glycosyltransferase involved in cell wall biosynthesis [Algoriphagus sp. 4150]|uniref:glycosyltransferase n=1 Tax=Algoriphagus sp. 4150 TaxID=2817756 RepID=UPI002860A8B5|nr:glycosyltransferase [Algoriphagus sp. 4150]MDR7130531.1 glycosyltransferase involved in cell wall biosynthesis [Algoriphagus sp. 4150]
MVVSQISTDMHVKNITYLASLDKNQSPGVFKKMLGTVAGAKQAGHSAKLKLLAPKHGFLKKFVEEIDHSDADILIIRSLCQYNFSLIPAFIRARARGKKIILDVPTPNAVAVRELADGNTGLIRKIKDLTYLLLPGSIPFWFVSRILQYAKEGLWFSMGNRRRTSYIGNGIQVASVPERKEAPHFDGTSLKLICVASLNYWHGVDRLIHAISTFNAEENGLKVYLKVVGKGACFSSLQALAEDLDLQQYISFLGFLEGDDLYREYESAHMAVGSLALFRKKLQSASELKSREYCAVGIPFIVVGDDPDFPRETKFRIQLPNRENRNDLTDFFREFDSKYLTCTPNEIRNYAWENLDFSVKIKEILNTIED